jgi:PleD family two-component response regulator
MKKRRVLISGHSLSFDEELYGALQKIATVLKISDNHWIESLLAYNPVDLVIIEISEENSAELELIKRIKDQFPNTVIILIDGSENREVIARAFSYGVKDAFRKPYNRDLIVERVKTLLNQSARVKNISY